MPMPFEKAKDFIFWHQRLLDIGGLWPLEPCGIKFYALLFYCIAHLCAALANLAQVFGDMSLMVENLCETALLVMVLAKIPALKYSSLMRNVVREILASENDEDNYRSQAERDIYISYSFEGLQFLKSTIRISLIATWTFYVKTMLHFLIVEIFGDGTTTYVIPYHIHIFMNITDIRVYILVYICQCPMIYVFTCHGLIACMMWSLVIHVCGQLSVLAFRIKNIKASTTGENEKRLESDIHRIIQRHNKMIQTSKDLEKIFRIFLLDELAICSVITGLCMYNILVLNSTLEDILVYFSYMTFIVAMFMITYGWCLIGNFLKEESMNVLNAYYECEWYDMPPRCQKLIIICMIRARSPLYISGGGFYIYTLTSFTSVVKSAMAYASMLRQLD